MKTFMEPAKEIPVYGKYDTVVVGGGFAGIAAALAAARGGNSVLLCEKMFVLGGLGTAGLVQVLSEFAPDIDVILEQDGKLFKYTLKQLIPKAFSM